MANKDKRAAKGALILKDEARAKRNAKREDRISKRKKKKEEGGRGFIIFVVAFLLIIAILVAVVAIVAAVRHKNTVISLEGVRMDKEVAAFFVSMYRTEYTAAVKAQLAKEENSRNRKTPDDEGYFDELAEDGRTNREVFEELANSFLKQILTASVIFDSVRDLTDEEEEDIQRVIDEVVEYKADGSIERFNELTAKYGFDYDSFCDATTMYYKALSSLSVLYGAEGSSISQNATVCGSYLQEYAHVDMIIVRTETRLITDGEGKDYNVLLTDTERAARQELIERMDAAMTAYKTNSDGKMTATAFDAWLASSTDSGTEWINTGYYFHESAEMTAEFSEAIPGVVETALGMQMYSFESLWTEIEIERDGETYREPVKVYLYRYPPTDKAYADSRMTDVWFSDFYSDATVYLYNTTLLENMELVEDGGFAESFNYVQIPKNIDILPVFD